MSDDVNMLDFCHICLKLNEKDFCFIEFFQVALVVFSSVDGQNSSEAGLHTAISTLRLNCLRRHRRENTDLGGGSLGGG